MAALRPESAIRTLCPVLGSGRKLRAKAHVRCAARLGNPIDCWDDTGFNAMVTDTLHHGKI